MNRTLLTLAALAMTTAEFAAAQSTGEIARDRLSIILANGIHEEGPWLYAGERRTLSSDPVSAEFELEELRLELTAMLAYAQIPDLRRDEITLQLEQGQEPLGESILEKVNQLRFNQVAVELEGLHAALDDYDAEGNAVIVMAAKAGTVPGPSWEESFQMWCGLDHSQDFEGAAMLWELGLTPEQQAQGRLWTAQILEQRYGSAASAPLDGPAAVDLRSWRLDGLPVAGFDALSARPGDPRILETLASAFSSMGLTGLSGSLRSSIPEALLVAGPRCTQAQLSEIERLQRYHGAHAIDPLVIEVASLGGSLRLAGQSADAVAAHGLGSLRLATTAFRRTPGPRSALTLSRVLAAWKAPHLAWGLARAAVAGGVPLTFSDLAWIALLSQAVEAPAPSEEVLSALVGLQTGTQLLDVDALGLLFAPR